MIQAQLGEFGPEMLRIWELLVVWITTNIFFIKSIAIFTAFVLLAGIVYVGGKTLIVFREFKGLTWRDLLGIGHRWSGRYLKIWRTIEEDLESRERQRMRTALMNADDMFVKLLGIMGYQGETFEECIEAATTAQFSNLPDLKRAHQFVINISRNVEKKFSYEEAKEILDIYKEALEEVDALRE